MKETEIAWFRPLWRRVAVTVFIAAWLVWEVFWTHDQFWMMITGAALAYAVWTFFIKFDSSPGKPGGGDDAKPQG